MVSLMFVHAIDITTFPQVLGHGGNCGRCCKPAATAEGALPSRPNTVVDSVVAIVARCVANDSRFIALAACDLFDRSWSVCYGDFRKSFSVFLGGDQRFRYWPFAVLRRPTEHSARANGLGSSRRPRHASVLFALFLGADFSKAAPVFAAEPADRAFLRIFRASARSARPESSGIAGVSARSRCMPRDIANWPASSCAGNPHGRSQEPATP